VWGDRCSFVGWVWSFRVVCGETGVPFQGSVGAERGVEIQGGVCGETGVEL